MLANLPLQRSITGHITDTSSSALAMPSTERVQCYRRFRRKSTHTRRSRDPKLISQMATAPGISKRACVSNPRTLVQLPRRRTQAWVCGCLESVKSSPPVRFTCARSRSLRVTSHALSRRTLPVPCYEFSSRQLLVISRFDTRLRRVLMPTNLMLCRWPHETKSSSPRNL